MLVWGDEWRMQRRGPVSKAFDSLQMEKMPHHVAVIMDGNGRWAKAQGKRRTTGHRAGMERMVQMVRTSSDLGLTALTLYAFSTENWKRPRPEVEALFSLLVEYIRREIDELHRNNVKLQVMGEISALPTAALVQVRHGCELTRNNTGMVLNIALNYGGRDELVRAARSLAQQVALGALAPEDIDQAALQAQLYTHGLPDPDLLIRTSGEQRLSNFMPYQLAYAEFVFVDEHWPDFDDEVYARCLQIYAGRERRFGDIGGAQ